MAMIRNFICSVCNSASTGCVNPGTADICNSCVRKKVDRDKREYFHGLDGLTTEERLRRIEEFIYNYKVPANTRILY